MKYLIPVVGVFLLAGLAHFFMKSSLVADSPVDSSDFKDLKNNKRYDHFLIGNLKVTTGKIVCADPMYRKIGYPQKWLVKFGSYLMKKNLKKPCMTGAFCQYFNIQVT